MLGIYWINIIIFALPSGSYYLPILGEQLHIPEFIYWSFTEVFVEGSMRGLFSILFGASAMVFLDEAKLAHQGLDVVDRYYRRNLLLVVFGLIHSYLLLWPYDVLYAYGLLGLFLFPLRKLSSPLLIVFGCLLLLYSHVNLVTNFSKLASTETAITKNDKNIDNEQSAYQGENHVRDKIRDVIEENSQISYYHSSYSRILNYQLNDVIDQHSSVMYTQHIFDIGGMMLIGMALLKLGVLSGQRPRRYYMTMALAGYLSGGLFRIIGIYMQLKYDFDLFEDKGNSGIDYDIGRLPITLGHIGVIGLLCQNIKMQFLINTLAAVGRLALTNYIMQTIISIFLFYGFGFTLFNKLNSLQIITVCLGVWAFQITFSLLWLQKFRLGPLEWLWRSLIYGKRQAIINRYQFTI